MHFLETICVYASILPAVQVELAVPKLDSICAKRKGCGSRRGTSCGQRDCLMNVPNLVHSVPFLVEMEPPALVEVAVAA
jgi:hypothetical protein